MVVRQPLLQRRWQQQLLLGFVGKEVLLINDSPLLDWAHHTPKHSPTVFLGRAPRESDGSGSAQSCVVPNGHDNGVTPPMIAQAVND